MEANKARTGITFAEILAHLSAIQGSVEASFASKMLSIINPEMPVLDSMVLYKLGLKKPSPKSPSRMDETVVVYHKICEWYTNFFGKEDFTKWIALFDEHFPNSGISDVKKVDFVLWQMAND